MSWKISKWNNIELRFFLESVFPRFWNHLGKTQEMIIEVQYMPALYAGEPNRRAFIGAGITLDFPYSQRKDTLKEFLLKEHGIGMVREYEKNHALGFVMTGDNTYKIDCITLSYNIKPAYQVFMQNFGVEGYKSGIIMFWYNLRKDGKVDTENVRPGKESMIRVRFLKVPYFMEIMKEYVESEFKYFPPEFIKDDYKI